jgi:hypothetical protein
MKPFVAIGAMGVPFDFNIYKNKKHSMHILSSIHISKQLFKLPRLIIAL